MEYVAVIATSAFLVSLCIAFLSVWKGFLSRQVDNRSAQPILVTASGVVLIGVFLGSLFVGQEVLLPAIASDRGTATAEVQLADASSAETLTLLADAVDKAAMGVYGGLDTTKDFIGKTEARKVAIERGRDDASEKLGALSQRIRSASAQNTRLHPLDQRVAQHVTAGLI
ncbi:MAG: hypothetical protein AAFX01_12670 [Cyanobacteria bacterium J06638_28]